MSQGRSRTSRNSDERSRRIRRGCSQADRLARCCSNVRRRTTQSSTSWTFPYSASRSVDRMASGSSTTPSRSGCSRSGRSCACCQLPHVPEPPGGPGTWGSWQHAQLRPLREHPLRLGVVLDPDAILSTDLLAEYGNVQEVDDWVVLRRTFEQHRASLSACEQPRLILLLRSSEFREVRDLPWDISHEVLCLRVQWPVPPDVRLVFRSVGPPLADAVVRLAEDGYRTPVELVPAL